MCPPREALPSRLKWWRLEERHPVGDWGFIPPELRGNLGVILMQPPSSGGQAYMGRLHARDTCIRVRAGRGERGVREEDVSEHASPSYLSLA